MIIYDTRKKNLILSSAKTAATILVNFDDHQTMRIFSSSNSFVTFFVFLLLTTINFSSTSLAFDSQSSSSSSSSSSCSTTTVTGIPIFYRVFNKSSYFGCTPTPKIGGGIGGIGRNILHNQLDRYGRPQFNDLQMNDNNRHCLPTTGKNFNWFSNKPDVQHINITEGQFQSINFYPGHSFDITRGFLYFTAEIHLCFVYKNDGDESLTITSDGDLWLYLNRRLFVDLGGIHSTTSITTTLDGLGLTVGKIYRLDIFFAQRYRLGTNVSFRFNLCTGCCCGGKRGYNTFNITDVVDDDDDEETSQITSECGNINKTYSPTKSPTTQSPSSPTKNPNPKSPTLSPTKEPTVPVLTKQPTSSPSPSPTTKQPTLSSPTSSPTKQPTSPTNQPTNIISPTNQPTSFPTKMPTNQPTISPTILLTNQPTSFPTNQPTLTQPSPPSPPSSPPTILTNQPTFTPTINPTNQPTFTPTNQPTLTPTTTITIGPTNQPTPSLIPTSQPTPSLTPTTPSTNQPTHSFIPTNQPTLPTSQPTFSPTTTTTTTSPTKQPTLAPTKAPTNMPTSTPTAAPTAAPTQPPPPQACCGNGIVELGEQCDNGLANSDIYGNCTHRCRFPVCGDGIIHRCNSSSNCTSCMACDNSEECDDGNNINGDGCDANCRFECNPLMNSVALTTVEYRTTNLINHLPDCPRLSCVTPPKKDLENHMHDMDFTLLYWIKNYCYCTTTSSSSSSSNDV